MSKTLLYAKIQDVAAAFAKNVSPVVKTVLKRCKTWFFDNHRKETIIAKVAVAFILVCYVGSKSVGSGGNTNQSANPQSLNLAAISDESSSGSLLIDHILGEVPKNAYSGDLGFPGVKFGMTFDQLKSAVADSYSITEDRGITFIMDGYGRKAGGAYIDKEVGLIGVTKFTKLQSEDTALDIIYGTFGKPEQQNYFKITGEKYHSGIRWWWIKEQFFYNYTDTYVEARIHRDNSTFELGIGFVDQKVLSERLLRYSSQMVTALKWANTIIGQSGAADYELPPLSGLRLSTREDSTMKIFDYFNDDVNKQQPFISVTKYKQSTSTRNRYAFDITINPDYAVWMGIGAGFMAPLRFRANAAIMETVMPEAEHRYFKQEAIDDNIPYSASLFPNEYLAINGTGGVVIYQKKNNARATR